MASQSEPRWHPRPPASEPAPSPTPNVGTPAAGQPHTPTTLADATLGTEPGAHPTYLDGPTQHTTRAGDLMGRLYHSCHCQPSTLPATTVHSAAARTPLHHLYSDPTASLAAGPTRIYSTASHPLCTPTAQHGPSTGSPTLQRHWGTRSSHPNSPLGTATRGARIRLGQRSVE